MDDYLVLSWEYLVPFLLSWVYLGEGGNYIHTQAYKTRDGLKIDMYRLCTQIHTVTSVL